MKTKICDICKKTINVKSIRLLFPKDKACAEDDSTYHEELDICYDCLIDKLNAYTSRINKEVYAFNKQLKQILQK